MNYEDTSEMEMETERIMELRGSHTIQVHICSSQRERTKNQGRFFMEEMRQARKGMELERERVTEEGPVIRRRK